MKVHKRFLLTILALGTFAATQAQENTEVFKKHDNLYISFGAGSSVLRQFPPDIYFAGSNNLQLGLMYERAFHKRLSVVAGVEFEQVTYNFDGDIQFGSNAGFTLIEAGPDKKYTGLRQRNIAIPLQGRFYFLENNAASSRNMFVQSGLRFVQSLDFLGAETSYFYRSEDENETLSLSDFTNQTSLQLELMIGFKGQFFQKFDLLNASTLGFMYQLNPMFDDNSSEILPIHFTWRFLF
ncbi:MAG: hypothetical protein AAGE93_14620 [Bacteroidota bacterium]